MAAIPLVMVVLSVPGSPLFRSATSAPGRATCLLYTPIVYKLRPHPPHFRTLKYETTSGWKRKRAKPLRHLRWKHGYLSRPSAQISH